VGRKEASFGLHLAWLAMQMGVKKCPSFLLGNQSSPDALGSILLLLGVFTIAPTKRLGILQSFSKSELKLIDREVSNTELRWVQKFDLKMRQQNRHVVLTLDNFSGHEFAYQPTNVKLVFFEPNLTAFVQPLDAGVICCLKAHYRSAFCHRALELDDAGERDIYKIDLLEAMHMVNDAWDNVTSTTIEHCWDHTGIQRAPIILQIPAQQQASNDENPTTITPSHARTTQGEALEVDLLKSVEELKNRNRIFGPTPLLEELLDPVDEEETGHSPVRFEGGDAEIIAQVRHEQAVACGEVIEVDSDNDDEEDAETPLSNAEVTHMCGVLEQACLRSLAKSAFDTARMLHCFRAEFSQIESRNAKQATLTSLWGTDRSHDVTLQSQV
jgi:hypothetical protein